MTSSSFLLVLTLHSIRRSSPCPPFRPVIQVLPGFSSSTSTSPSSSFRAPGSSAYHGLQPLLLVAFRNREEERFSYRAIATATDAGRCTWRWLRHGYCMQQQQRQRPRPSSRSSVRCLLVVTSPRLPVCHSDTAALLALSPPSAAPSLPLPYLAVQFTPPHLARSLPLSLSLSITHSLSND